MNPENPWIDATLEGFPEDDPKNPKRRHLLEETAASLPPAWHHPERILPDPPEELKSTTSWISRNLSPSFLITLGVSLLVLWLTIFSPSANHRLRGIFLADSLIRSVDDYNLAPPLRLFYAIDDAGANLPEWLESDIARRIPPDRRFLCLGNLHDAPFTNRWQSLWESSPKDPALFAERVRELEEFKTEKLDQFLEETQLIDPGNIYYELLVLMALAEDSVERTSVSGTKSKPRHQVALITDPVLYEQAWVRLDRVLAAERFESHVPEMVNRRLDGWLPPKDYPDLARDICWLYLIQPSTRALPYSSAHLGTLFAARADEIAASGRPEEMSLHCKNWRSMMRLLASSDSGRWGWISYWGFANLSYESMAEACRAHSLGAEEKFFSDYGSIRSTISSSIDLYSTNEFASSLTESFTSDSSSDPSPGRLAEHRMFEGLYLTWAAIALLVILVLGSFLTVVISSRLMGLPARFSKLLSPLDRMMIFAIGTLLPMIFIALTLEIPPLHLRETTFGDQHALAVALKLSAMVVAVICLTIRQTSRCLSKRAWPVGFSPLASGPLLGMALISLGCSLAGSILLQTDSIPEELLKWIWIGFFAMLGLELMLLFFGAAVLLYSGHRRVQTATALRASAPIFACAALFVTGLVFIERKVEELHVSSAQLERIDSDDSRLAIHGLSGQTVELRQKILDYLETSPTSGD